MTRKNSSAKDRRRHQRFSFVEGLIEPIVVRFDGGPRSGREQPAILTNLSAGGMSLVCFAEPPRAKNLDMVLSLPGLKAVPIVGKVARLSQKGHTWNVGIAFTKITRQHQDLINSMAQDNEDCETRLSLNLPDACAPKCKFHKLCMKPQKVPQYWKS